MIKRGPIQKAKTKLWMKRYLVTTVIVALLIFSFGSKPTLAESKLQGGLSTTDAQNMICDGTYGGKEWSTSQRQIACQRVGRNLDSFMIVHLLQLVFAATLLITIVGYIFYRYKNKRKTFKSLAPKKARQK
jgi:hypothetical protein